jgi:hypothetical protein
VSQTGMKDSPALTDLYRETLPWGLQSPIIWSKHPPKMLEEWYTKATNFYVGHQRVQRLFRKRDNKPATTPSALPAQKKFSFPEKKDPNAMNIDRMSIKERTRLMKEGKWFRCKLFGHLSWDCPNKGQNTMTTTTTLKWTGKSTASHIRNLYCLNEWRREEGFGRRRWEAWIGFLKRRTASTSAPPLYIFLVHGSDNNNSFHIDAIITTPEKNEPIKTQPLVDSGAGGTFMDQNYAWKHRFNLMKLKYPITAWNVDRTKNKQGAIQYYTDLDLQVNSKTNTEQFLITGLGNQKIILGLPWLREHNPEINWKEGTLQ